MTNPQLEKFAVELSSELDSMSEGERLGYFKAKLEGLDDDSRKLVETIIDVIKCLPDDGSRREKVLVLVHGIRTRAEWQEGFRALVAGHSKMAVYPIKYDYFDAFRFWFPWRYRKKPIERVLREIRDIRKRHKNSDIVVVAHSFGTYIVSKILSDEPDVCLHSLLLSGAIIPTSYRWDNVTEWPSGGVVNDCGSRDIWPVMAKAFSWGYGASGTFGVGANRVVDRFHNLRHSDFFDTEFMTQYWLPFVLEGDVVESEWSGKRPASPWLLNVLELAPIKTIIVAIAILVASSFFAF